MGKVQVIIIRTVVRMGKVHHVIHHVIFESPGLVMSSMRGAVKPRERETSPTQIFAPPSPDRSFELGVFPTSDAARSILTPSGPAEPPRARARVLPVLPLGDRPESTSCALVVLPQAQFKSIP